MRKFNYYIIGLICNILAMIFLFFNSYELKAVNGGKKILYQYSGYDAFLCIDSEYASAQLGGIIFILFLIFSLIIFGYILVKRNNSRILTKMNLYLIGMCVGLLFICTINGMENIHSEVSILKSIYISKGWRVDYYKCFGSIFAIIFLCFSFISLILHLFLTKEPVLENKKKKK